MSNVDEIYGGIFLNVMTLKVEKLINKPLTITEAVVEDIGGTTHSKPKIVLSLEETEKRLALNKTNAQIIKEAYGNETDEWIGKKIWLQLTKRQFQGNIVDAIEVVIRNV